MSTQNLNEIKTELSTLTNSNIITKNKLPSSQDYNRSPTEKKQIEEIENLKSTREMREEYAKKSYTFAKCTLIGWAILVFLYVLAPDKNKVMDVKIFGIITAACTINILVAFHAVIKGLFSHK